MAVAGPMQIGPGTELGLQAALQGLSDVPGRTTRLRGCRNALRRPPGAADLGRKVLASVLVRSPYRRGGAQVADFAGLVHGAQREGMLRAAKQTIDLHRAAIGSGQDRHVADSAASDPAAARDRLPLSVIDECHPWLPLAPPPAMVFTVGADAPVPQWRIGTGRSRSKRAVVSIVRPALDSRSGGAQHRADSTSRVEIVWTAQAVVGGGGRGRTRGGAARAFREARAATGYRLSIPGAGR
jgi:hypothetical protein